jgi:hypothetical protein
MPPSAAYNLLSQAPGSDGLPSDSPAAAPESIGIETRNSIIADLVSRPGGVDGLPADVLEGLPPSLDGLFAPKGAVSTPIDPSVFDELSTEEVDAIQKLLEKWKIPPLVDPVPLTTKDDWNKRTQDPIEVAIEIARLRPTEFARAIDSCRFSADRTKCQRETSERFTLRDKFVMGLQAADRSGICSAGAKKMLEYVVNNCTGEHCAPGEHPDLSTTIGPDFDRSCLSPVLAETLAPAVRDRALEGQVAVTALLVVRGAGLSYPFCTAVITGPDTIATARHCFKSGDLREALVNGRIEARPLLTPDSEGWVVMPPTDTVLDTLFRTSDIHEDSLQLKIHANLQGLPVVKFEVAKPNSLAFVASYFGFHEPPTVPAAPPYPIKAGIRESKPGLCRIYESDDQCVRLFCQTIGGFSGAPIFSRAPRSATDPVIVYGLVSGGEGYDGKCGSDSGILLTAGPTRVRTD